MLNFTEGKYEGPFARVGIFHNVEEKSASLSRSVVAADHVSYATSVNTLFEAGASKLQVIPSIPNEIHSDCNMQ